jgi:hypothetical protein
MAQRIGRPRTVHCLYTCLAESADGEYSDAHLSEVRLPTATPLSQRRYSTTPCPSPNIPAVPTCLPTALQLPAVFRLPEGTPLQPTVSSMPSSGQPGADSRRRNLTTAASVADVYEFRKVATTRQDVEDFGWFTRSHLGRVCVFDVLSIPI